MSSLRGVLDIRMFRKECLSARAAGHDVALVAPHPEDATIEGIRVLGVPPPTSRARRWTRTIWQVYRRARREKADLYHFHDPELIPVALLLKLGGRRVLYDAREQLPAQVLSKEWIPRILRRPASVATAAVEKLASLAFDGILAATPPIAERFPAKKTALVQNYPIPDELVTPQAPPQSARPATFACVGNLGPLAAPDIMVRAVGEIRGARLLIAGPLRPPSLEQELRKLPGGEQTTFLGWTSRESVAKVLAEARAGLCVHLPTPNHDAAQPVKLYEYMAAGIPVVVSDIPRWRAIVEGARCGLVVPAGDARALADALRWILAHPEEADEMGRRGARAVRERYSWDGEAARMFTLYETITRDAT